jgi:hypothetical protein
MRRSKSDPSKYASNYRKISQRHMTGYGDDDVDDDDHDGKKRAPGVGVGTMRSENESEERGRLEDIMRQSEMTWRRGLAAREGTKKTNKGNDDDDDDAGRRGKVGNDDDDDMEGNGRMNVKNEKRMGGGDSKNTDDDDVKDDNDNDHVDMLSLLSPELRAQFAGMGNDAIVVLPGKRKKKKKNSKETMPPPQLTPMEIKAAKAAYKNAQRKLAQLDMRKRAKETRAGLYRELEENTLIRHRDGDATGNADGNADGGDRDGGDGANGSNGSKSSKGNATNAPPPPIDVQRRAAEARGLLLRSSELGKKLTKRERLKRLRHKEVMGIPLTPEEMDVLYVERDAPHIDTFTHRGEKMAEKTNFADVGDGNSMNVMSKGKRRKKDTESRRIDDRDDDAPLPLASVIPVTVEKLAVPAAAVASSPAPSIGKDVVKTNADDDDGTVEGPINQSFSHMMFAGLSKLKTTTDVRNAELAIEVATKLSMEEEMAARLEEEERKRRKVYVPSSEPITVSTMHHLYNDTNKAPDIVQKRNVAVQQINRPASIEESRYNLPVSSMEYEIIDAVRSNDCTILCGETGSGKSTQVPQFLYEAGFGTSSWWQMLERTSGNPGGRSEDGRCYGKDDCDESKSTHLLIGITQPRRVAAVSTAKRVCFEMGCGDGQKISNDNLVAYQTRYETAGLGKSTRVKFMTDGILLQEIQSDLLLRKYGAIVIDEAHERNLNTDVLLGLLSLALPMRRKAAEEGSLPPLKLVIMSATLRVEDFVNNDRLFPERNEGRKDGAIEPRSNKPAVVTVPGRTHPVSIHHSKVTELDDYGKCGAANQQTPSFHPPHTRIFNAILSLTQFLCGAEKLAMEKVCKIHRKLPAGGILVFLTGKQEIIRCINRLKQRLQSSNRGRRIANNASDKKDHLIGRNDVRLDDDALNSCRDMDDDEVDGDLFQKEEDEDDYDGLKDDVDAEIEVALPASDNDDARPKQVLILPLYSMLSADEQAKVFSPVPEDTRLIVIATNIAETSITIPVRQVILSWQRRHVYISYPQYYFAL